MAKSIIGFHYSIGGNKNGIGDFMEQLNQAGIPFLMKGTDDAGLCFEGQVKGAAHGVGNHLIYRVSTAGQPGNVEYDVPDYLKSPKAAAQEHFDKTAAKWPPELDRSIVWMEPINEPRAKLNEGDVQWGHMNPVDWLGEFMVEYAKIANGQGFKVCGPSFNSGEPEVFGANEYEQPGMLDYFLYCASNPEQAALSVHEYTWSRWLQGESWPDWYPSLWGRVEAAIAAADIHNIPRTFNIFMTEWGFAHDDAPRWPECEPFLTAYNEWAARWPMVKGVSAWTLSEGWGQVDLDLQSWLEPLGNYAVDNDFPAGEQPARTHELFGGTKPGENPVNELHQKIWDMSTAELKSARGIKLPNSPILWKRLTEHTAGYILGHNEIGVQHDGKTYKVQRGIDPHKVLPDVVGIWSAAGGLYFIDSTLEVVELPAPFEVIDVVDDLATHPTLEYVTRPLSAVETITIHHTVSGGGSNPLAEIKNIALYHISPRENVPQGWPGIGYHFCVGSNGEIYQVNRLETKSYHAGSWGAPGDENYSRVGVALLGNFSYSPPPPAQLDAARALVTYLRATLPAVGSVEKHQDAPGAQTQCPGNTWPEWFGYVAGEAQPVPPNKIDLLPYLRGDGRMYTVKHADGQQENFQCQRSGNLFWLVKNSQYEEFMYDANFIYRRYDTSPGPAPPYAELPGELRYYRQFEPGKQWARWCPRHMAVGETWTGPGHVVEYFYKDGCVPSAANSGGATNRVTLKARHFNKVWNGNTIADAVEFWTGTTSEGMFFGFDWSLVSWGNQEGGASAVWERLPDSTPDLVREVLPCL